MKYYRKALKAICDIQNVIAIAALLGMIGLNSVEIFRRYFFGKSWIWIQEITVLLLVFFTFFGFSKVVYDKNDIAIDLVLSKLPPFGRKTLQLALYLLVLAFCVIYSFYSYKLVLAQAAQVTVIARHPMNWRTIPALVNGITMCLIYIQEIIDTLFEKMEEAKEQC